MKTRINIASFGGRTHLLDTARELDKAGYDVRFYSFVPDSRAIQFGLRKECNHSLLWFAWPYLIWLKIFGFGGWGTLIYMTLCDWLMCIYMKPCDIMIGQSPMHYQSLRYAKRKWNAITILERGTSHVLEYLKHLGKADNLNTFQKLVNRIDAKAYPIPDYISVGSEHVKDSFILHGISPDKIIVNNYGFDSSHFAPTERTGDFDIIMVGTWCFRKGCDRLTEICKDKGYRCLHVGNIGDIDFPNDENFHHIDPVDESKLTYYYKQAKIFVLLSREEGLALVLLQASACGLPIVCSKYSGGKDIRKYTEKHEFIKVVEIDDITTINKAIENALALANMQKGTRNYLGKGLSETSFEAYGKRYADFLNYINNKS